MPGLAIWVVWAGGIHHETDWCEVVWLTLRAASRRNAAMSSLTIQRLERALAAVSYAIVQDGPVYAPLLERLEREIEELRAADDVVARARRHLQRLRDQAAERSFEVDGRVKAIA